MNVNNVAVIMGLLVLSACGSDSPGGTARTLTNPPNIIVLLLDDAGYADFGFMGSTDLQTPNIDRLAQQGIVFSDAHVSSSVCGPSRAGLITGRYQQRFGFECNPRHHYDSIPRSVPTIGEVLQTAGYTTSAFGKWHLGDRDGYKPNDRGFDYHWGFLSGGRSYFPNEKNDQPGAYHSIRENDEHRTFEGYLTDRLGDQAVAFIDRQKDQDTPFFMYWSPNAVHTPMEATEADLARFQGHERQTLAAMTWALDRAVGNIVDKLEAVGMLENTLIFFLSDNGGAHNNQSDNHPLKGFKGNEYEGGHRVPFFAFWPQGLEAGTFDGLTSSLDIFATACAVGGITDYQDQFQTDGVNLIPYLTGAKTGDPHDQLFWRKDKMAAARRGDLKMLRVEEGLGYRLYDLSKDMGESDDLRAERPQDFGVVQSKLTTWESQLKPPRWTEPEAWNQVTMMIHEDLYHNRSVRVKNPEQLRAWKAEQE